MIIIKDQTNATNILHRFSHYSAIGHKTAARSDGYCNF